MPSSTCTNSTTTSLADYQLSSDNDSQTLFDKNSIESILAQIQAARVKPQQQLTDILCSYLDEKNYPSDFIDARLNPSFFGTMNNPSALFLAFGSDFIANKKDKEQYSNVTFLEVFKNRSQAGEYKNMFYSIRRSAREMLDRVRRHYNILPKWKTSDGFAQATLVKIFIAFNLI
jgi:hypothetical protein